MSVLVTKQAPDFKANTVMADGSIKSDFSLSDFKGKYVVLFFWPMDFTFVCPTEIIAHDQRIEEFNKRNVQVIGVSIDTQHTHIAWRNTEINQGGIGQIRYPMVSDVKHEITQAYGVEHPDGVALRASFLIDKDGIVQHETINNLALGRNIDEMLRVIDALQYSEKYGEVCPAGWQKGDEAMKPSHDGVAEYLGSHADKL